MAPQPSKRILVVDDDPGQRSLLTSFLTGQGYECLVAVNGREALEALEAGRFAMMISDVRMPEMTGLEALHRIREDHPSMPVLMVTAFPDIKDAVTAMQDGAVNYLQKPIDLEELLFSVRSSTGEKGVDSPAMVGGRVIPEGVVAESPLMRQILRDASLVARSESRILLTGESGVGKEVVANLIHDWSARASGPFVKINCAAIPEDLLESELFGHQKGAFTGATHDRVGKFEEANNGTILLDEIGDMSASLQAKLLRITQDGTYQRLGSNRDGRTDARILAATNHDLEKEVAEGRFREDLFYRLNVMEINIPALRERREDLLPLARSFAAEFSDGSAKLSSAVSDLIEQYGWPGNVRELRHAMERAVLVANSDLILPEHLPPRIRRSVGERAGEAGEAGDDVGAKASTGLETGSRLEDIELMAILQALRECGFNRTEAARKLSISRRSLTYKLAALRKRGCQVDP